MSEIIILSGFMIVMLAIILFCVVCAYDRRTEVLLKMYQLKASASTKVKYERSF